ncbi:hypothetical protein Mp_3g20800 [Marchantia polymorpha subsp. ruderalis]|uniref:Uncharacterized protein n=2 Tax=Marchantia polymorpha TaxID=3197 RepID=A0AAF6B314_MARPO|nr:hypothetical protein MARPO_0159s0010 [Marchantia polymorpha]BBN06398.1 hypothetical protein Mp_3g20800 [Marchantia polymorpha subsp. ruderalis]|eukprot:PTQ28593.1 hypothetical protein MARPO_0159s0010 [Marchantia polymorpha]
MSYMRSDEPPISKVSNRVALVIMSAIFLTALKSSHAFLSSKYSSSDSSLPRSPIARFKKHVALNLQLTIFKYFTLEVCKILPSCKHKLSTSPTDSHFNLSTCIVRRTVLRLKPLKSSSHSLAINLDISPPQISSMRRSRTVLQLPIASSTRRRTWLRHPVIVESHSPFGKNSIKSGPVNGGSQGKRFAFSRRRIRYWTAEGSSRSSSVSLMSDVFSSSSAESIPRVSAA